MKNFITLPWGFHWEFHYYIWALSLGISLLYLGDFIGNFIIIPGHFYCNFHSCTREISLGISLLYLGISLGISLLYLEDFITIFIIIPRCFHWKFHYYTWGFHWGFHYYAWRISLQFSLLYLGAFMEISWGFHWGFHYYIQRISLLCLEDFIAIFIIIPGQFHCEFCYYMMHSNYRTHHQSSLLLGTFGRGFRWGKNVFMVYYNFKKISHPFCSHWDGVDCSRCLWIRVQHGSTRFPSVTESRIPPNTVTVRHGTVLSVVSMVKSVECPQRAQYFPYFLD